MIKVESQWKRVAEIAKSSPKEFDQKFRMVYLRNGILFASNGYVLSATRFPSSVIMTTQMTYYRSLMGKETDETKLWNKCEGQYLSYAEQLWTCNLTSHFHTKGKAITLNTKYLTNSIDLKEEMITIETGLKFEPVMIISGKVKTIIMPIQTNNDNLDEWNLGLYKELHQINE